VRWRKRIFTLQNDSVSRGFYFFAGRVSEIATFRRFDVDALTFGRTTRNNPCSYSAVVSLFDDSGAALARAKENDFADQLFWHSRGKVDACPIFSG
jgi:hypothetical protein